jgi:hypothetical protein
MRYQNRLADAKAQAIQFVNQQPSNGSMQLLAVDSHATALTQPGSDKAGLVNVIGSMEATDETSSYGELARALRVMEQTTGLGLNVHFFTDAQQTSMPVAFTDLQLGPNTSLAIHESGTGASPNWAVQSVSVPARTYDAATVRLTAGFAGWQTGQANRKVTVSLDGHALASKDVTIPASGRTEAEFTGLVIPYGVHRGEVEMEPHDELPNDDRFLFSIERADPRKVLFLSAVGRAANSFFYKSAMDASPSAGLRVQPDFLTEAGRLDLSPYSVVVLNNPGEIDQAASSALGDYISKGGALLIGVGPATVRAGVIPVSGDHVSDSTATQGARIGTSEIFAANVFDNVQFLATPRITPQSGDRVMASFSDGSPLLLEQTKGEGRLLVFASTLDNATSDFPVHSGFLPFVVATGTYLAGDANDSSSNVVGDAVSLRQSRNQSASADVIGPDGQHEFPLSDATRIMSFNPVREGFYDVHPANGKRRLVAVHADRRESNLEKVPAETLILWRNTSNGGAVAPGTTTGSTIVPFSLWRYLLTLVLIAAIVESIFATRYLSEERQAS